MNDATSAGWDLQPTLGGTLLQMRPLRADDWTGLFAVASDPLIWEVHPARDRYKEDVFRAFFADALASGGALVALDRSTGAIVGSSRYNRFGPAKDELEIGWTFLARSHWGGKYNAEMKQLMLNHAFRFVDHVVFVVASTNIRSRRAMERVGGVLTDRRDNRAINGQPVEHVIYQISRPGSR